VKVDQKKKDQKEKQEGCITITSNRKSGVSEEPSAIEAGGSATIAETTVRMSTLIKSLLTLREVTSVTLFLLSLEEEEGKKEGEGEGEEAQSSVFTNDGASLYEYALHGRLLAPTVISSILSCLRQGSSSSSSICICICTIQIQYYLSLIKGLENGTVR
jgi:hypothetical protein